MIRGPAKGPPMSQEQEVLPRPVPVKCLFMSPGPDTCQTLALSMTDTWQAALSCQAPPYGTRRTPGDPDQPAALRVPGTGPWTGAGTGPGTGRRRRPVASGRCVSRQAGNRPADQQGCRASGRTACQVRRPVFFPLARSWAEEGQKGLARRGQSGLRSGRYYKTCSYSPHPSSPVLNQGHCPCLLLSVPVPVPLRPQNRCP